MFNLTKPGGRIVSINGAIENGKFSEKLNNETLSNLKKRQSGEKKNLKKEVKELLRQAKKFSKKDIDQKQHRKQIVKQTKEMLLNLEINVTKC